MNKEPAKWQTDWHTFVKDVAQRFASGCSEWELTELYGGKVVSWTGTVFENKVNEEYARGVAVNLPELRVPTKRNLMLVAGYQFLNVNDKTATEWSTVLEGDVVHFECTLGRGNEVFPGVQIAIFEEDNECVLKLTLEDAKLIAKGARERSRS